MQERHQVVKEKMHVVVVHPDQEISRKVGTEVLPSKSFKTSTLHTISCMPGLDVPETRSDGVG